MATYDLIMNKTRFIGASPNACWEWQGTTDKRSGHGVIQLRGPRRTRRVHREVWTHLFGDPGELGVLHRCDNPPCVNPRHLWLGTQSDNAKDMWAKGRANPGRPEIPLRGQQVGTAKLKDAQRDLILTEHANGASMRSLGRKYGVTHEAIRKIVRGWSLSRPV